MFGAVRELSALGMTELVIDLRDDPGGELLAFVELAGDFLEPGSVVVTMVDERGTRPCSGAGTSSSTGCRSGSW